MLGKHLRTSQSQLSRPSPPLLPLLSAALLADHFVCRLPFAYACRRYHFDRVILTTVDEGRLYNMTVDPDVHKMLSVIADHEKLAHH